MEITGYKKVNYDQLQRELQKNRDDKGDVHEINLAAAIDVKSVGTIRNCFDKEGQTV